jgi:signal transduction histidine kinase/ligand-binding sensor domain-containing protein
MVWVVILPKSGNAGTNVVLVRETHPQLLKKNITAITQDSTGFMWFGTDNGLIRFDGLSTRVYNHVPGDDSSLIDGHIRALYTDHEGRLWVVAEGGGLSLYQPETSSFKHFNPPTSRNGGGLLSRQLYDIDIWSITPGSGNTLWLSSFVGGVFFRFDIANESFTTFRVVGSFGSTSPSVNFVLEASNGLIWVGTDLDGVVVFDQQGEEVARFVHEPDNPGSLSYNSTRTIIEDQYGKIWISTYIGGLNVFNPEIGVFSQPEDIFFGIGDRFGNVYSLFLDNDLLWAATDDGLVVLDVRDGRMQSLFEHVHNNARSLVNNRVRAVYEDRSGTIWVGNENGGLHKLITSKAFENFVPNPKEPTALNANMIRSFLQIDENTLWVGTDGDGINQIDLSSGAITKRWVHDPRNDGSVQSNGITALAHDPEGGVWVGTWGGGLNYYNPQTNQFTSFKYSESDKTTISNNYIQMIRFDTKGRLWIGTQSGMNLMNRERGTFIRIFNEPDDYDGFFQVSVQSLAFIEDENDVFWIGTWFGFYRYDLANNNIRRYLADPGRPNTMRSNHILSLYDDGDGSIWMGTFNGGLQRFDKQTGAFEVLLDTDGLPGNVIFAVIPDDQGNLWLSSNNGLSRFNIESREILNFSELDGLQTSEFWWGSGYRAPDGKLFFGSVFGFTSFYPHEIQESFFQAPVVISRLQLFDKTLSVPVNGVIELSHRENYLSFEFASLDFTNPSRNQYAYKMEGLDPDWNFSDNRNFATYSALPGGRYTFRVRGTNSSGLWSENEYSLAIVINPPFWQTPLFYILSILGGLLLVLGFIRYRTESIRRQKQELEKQVFERTVDLDNQKQLLLEQNKELNLKTQQLQERAEEIESQRDIILANSRELEQKNLKLVELNQEKNSLIGIVAHDLRSPLATVMSGMEVIKMDPNMDRSQIDEIHGMMEDYIKRQLDMISRILDLESFEAGKITLHPEKTDLNKIALKLIEQLQTSAARKQINLVAETVSEDVFTMVDPDYMDQIVDNLISNALKFSPADTTAVVFTGMDDHTVWIGVRDQGPGITREDRKKLFNKFQKLSARPTGGEKSTGLGLSIVKRLTEAMGGDIRVESEPGKGATFTVTFPKV